MELPILFTLLVVYLLVCVIFGLIWYIYTQHENMYFERQDQAEERTRLANLLIQSANDATIERKDLYDRLQSGTLPQYKEHVADPNFVAEDPDEGIVDMDEAKDELMGVNNG